MGKIKITAVKPGDTQFILIPNPTEQNLNQDAETLLDIFDANLGNEITRLIRNTTKGYAERITILVKVPGRPLVAYPIDAYWEDVSSWFYNWQRPEFDFES